MITAEQAVRVGACAWVPEHLPWYVTAITRAEPWLIGDFIVYLRGDRLIFVGYPLSEQFQEAAFMAALDDATTRFNPRVTSITAPALPAGLTGCASGAADAYYLLDLTTVSVMEPCGLNATASVMEPCGLNATASVSKKLRNLLRRAGRDVTIRSGGRFGREHRRLVEKFLRSHQVDEGTQTIFANLARYAKTDEARLFEARDLKGELVAFDVADFGARPGSPYAFYLFNFGSSERYVPGASDLLLWHIILRAQAEGKRYLNLGLGIHDGVRRFKEKWGARPSVAHVSCVRERIPSPWEAALELLR